MSVRSAVIEAFERQPDAIMLLAEADHGAGAAPAADAAPRRWRAVWRSAGYAAAFPEPEIGAPWFPPSDDGSAASLGAFHRVVPRGDGAVVTSFAPVIPGDEADALWLFHQQEIPRARAQDARSRGVSPPLPELANLDDLTGLANRRGSDAHLEDLSSAACPSIARLGLLHIDLDLFKQVNDTLGHEAGDFVLQHVAAILNRATRNGSDFVARVGGDEFIVVLGLPSFANDAADVAERIIAAISKPLVYKGRSCKIGASIGIAYAEPGAFEPRQLVRDADLALYEAKRRGRNRYELFTPQLGANFERTQRLYDEVLIALEQDQFEPYLQPQFDAVSLDLVGAEALARWVHPTRGVITPGEFLGLAEERGLLKDIDELIYRKALAAASDLARRGVVVPKLSVNLSCERLRDLAFLYREREKSDYGGEIALELLETTLFEEQSGDFFWKLDQLSDDGFKVEIDDFGSGRASLLSLTTVNANTVKIDRGLVASVATSRVQKRMVQAIIEMARALDISVMAEGVETLEQAAVLRELGCRSLQGFAFAKPMPVDAFADFARAQSWRAAGGGATTATAV